MKIHFNAVDTPQAQRAKTALVARYGDCAAADCDVIVALGGDGAMLHALHDGAALKKSVYGMNRGSVGFLLNEYDEDDLVARISRAVPVVLHPLKMSVKTIDDTQHAALAINEVSILRETRQAAKVRIIVDGVVRLDELICDGAIIATPAGSTAYNLSAYGPILPLQANLLALTPISAFRPRRWRGALLPKRSFIRFEILDAENRPVSAVADFTEFRDIRALDVYQDETVDITLLFDPEMNLDERMLKEQFLP